MSELWLSIFFFAAIGSFFASAQQCANTLQFSSGSSKTFTQCQNLQAQGASFSWTYFSANNTLDMGFSGTSTSPSGWLGWGINPTSPRMDGTSALIAFRNSSGAHLLQYKISEANKASKPLTPSPIDFTVLDQSVDISGSNIKFTAILQFSGNQSTIFHIWNHGAAVIGDQPQSHSTSAQQGQGTLNLASGAASTGKIPNLHLKNAHGIINAISWGFLFPIGVIAARYLRPFEWADPAWFYIHASCQTLGYILGVVGWGLGLRLGHLSKGVVRHSHRNLGITLFVFATLQVLAMFLRPNKKHKLRIFWNIYHHSIGYSVIVLSIVNMFKGFDILQPAVGWKHAYVGIISALGAIAAVLEIITWLLYLRKRSRTPSMPLDQNQNQHHQRSGLYADGKPKWDEA